MNTFSKRQNLNIMFGLYITLTFCLFLYSFTQVDLNLTLSRSSLYQTAEKTFQYIGYFNRPLSTVLFISLLLFLFGFYIGFLILAVKRMITQKQVWFIIILSAILLTFSYNAFSYDIFNYIFDARIFTLYHQNPYLHKALDFPSDPMVHFMRWTQRTYPYGPVWLLVTIPLSFIGMQIFLPTFFLFKMLATGCFLGTCFFIQKISNKLFPKQEVYNLIFFALNPLVLIESLVSGHIDIVMMFFCMIAVWFLINKKWLLCGLFLLISIGIKFATVFLLLVFMYYVIASKAKQSRKSLLKFRGIFHFILNEEGIFISAALLMFLAVVAQSYDSGNFQPWYLLNVVPLASLVSKKYYVMIPTMCISLFALLEYTPFLYRGDWNPPVPTILTLLTISGVVLSVIIVLIWKFTQRKWTFLKE